MPWALLKEIRWSNEAIAELNNEGLVKYSELVSLRQSLDPIFEVGTMGEVHVAILQGMVRVPGNGGAADGSVGMAWCLAFWRHVHCAGRRWPG